MQKNSYKTKYFNKSGFNATINVKYVLFVRVYFYNHFLGKLSTYHAFCAFKPIKYRKFISFTNASACTYILILSFRHVYSLK